MRRFFFLFILCFLVSCGGQSKEELLTEGDSMLSQGNYRGAVVLYKNALEKDVNYLEARKGLAEAYLLSGSFGKAENEYQKVLYQNPSDNSVLLKLATVYLQQNKSQDALLELDKFHAANDATVESLTLYGRAHGASGDLESAEEMLKKALLLNANATEPRFYLAKVYIQQKYSDRARKLLREIIQLDAGYVRAYYLLAGIETREGKSDEALRTYQDLVQARPDELQAFYMIGMLQLDKGKMEEAQNTVNTILAKFSGRPEGLRLKGLLLYREGQYEDAILAFSSSLKSQQHILAYFFLGLSHYNLDQLELALNQFQKALDINPDFERARVLVAMTLLKQKRIDDAIIEIQKVLRKNPDDAYAHNVLGSAYLAKGDYDRGMAELETATEIDPSMSDAHLKRGLFHLSKGEGAQGESDLIKAVEAAPEVLNSRLMLVTHYLRQKNYSAAIETLKAGMDGSATDALLNNYLAAAYFSQKKPLDAIAALEKAKEVNPGYLTPYFNLASYYASESKYEKALAEYRAVVDRDSKNLKALFGMASIYNVLGSDVEVDKVFKTLEATGTEQGYYAAAVYQLRQNNPVGALAIVTRGLEQFPASATLLEMQGGMLREAGKFTEAENAYIKLSGVEAERGSRLLMGLYLQLKQNEKVIELLASAMKQAPEKDYPYLLSAGYSLSQQKVVEAVAVLSEGIEKVDNPNRLKMQLGSIYETQGDLLRAENLYQNVIAEAPRYAPAYTALGFIREKNGDKGKALEFYKDAIKYDQNNIAALNNAAYLLIDNFGQAQEALGLAMKAYRLKPSDPRVMDTLGYVLLRNDRLDDAMNLLKKSVELLPEIAAVKLHLAMVHERLGEKDKAKQLLQDVVASGTQEDIREANKLLKTL